MSIIEQFVYNRILHFQNCLKQFQGKQTCEIFEQVYVDLDLKYSAYHLLADSDNISTRYSRITTEHVMIFLKELKYIKHYKDINAIYFTLTNTQQETFSESLEKNTVRF